MLLDIFLSSGNIFVKLLTFLVLFPALLFALTCHEYAHGYAAYTQGDFYAKSMGRLSLNPFKHLDPLGTLCMLILGSVGLNRCRLFLLILKTAGKACC